MPTVELCVMLGFYANCNCNGIHFSLCGHKAVWKDSIVARCMHLKLNMSTFYYIPKCIFIAISLARSFVNLFNLISFTNDARLSIEFPSRWPRRVHVD